MAYARARKRRIRKIVVQVDGTERVVTEMRWYPSIYFDGHELGLGSCRTKEDADNAIFAAKTRIAKGLHPMEETKETVVTLGDVWRQRRDTAQKTGTWRKSTLALYEVTWEKHIEPVFGDVPVSEITRERVQGFINDLCMKNNGKGRPLSADTIDRIYRQLKLLVNEALENGYIERSPFRRIDKPTPGKRDRDFLALKETEKVLSQMDKQPKVYYTVLAYSGLRKSEARGLKRENIDFDKNEILVTGQWSAQNGYGELKTDSSKRAVPILRRLEPVLREYCEEEEFKPGDFLFRPKRCKANRPAADAFRGHLEKAFKTAGVRHVSIHSFRRFFVSLMIRSGMNIVEISRILGHSSIVVTLNHYADLFPNDLKEAASRASDFIEESLRELEENESDE